MIEQEYSFPEADEENSVHDIQHYLRTLCRFAAKRQPLVYLTLWESKRYSQVVELTLMRRQEGEDVLKRIEAMDYEYTEQITTALLVELLLLQ